MSAEVATRRLGAALCIAIGAGALVGWHTGRPLLTQYAPGRIALQYNTSVTILLLGAGLWITTTRARAWAWVPLAPTFLIPALTLVQQLAGSNFPLDQLLFAARSATGAPQPEYPGRMSPNAAVSLVLGAVAAVPMMRAATPVTTAIVGHIAAALVAIGGVATAGYVLRLPTYAWGPFTPISLPGAIAVTAIAIVGIVWTGAALRAGGVERAVWLPLPTGVAVFAATVIVWQAVIAADVTSVALIDEPRARRTVTELGVFAALSFAVAVALVQFARAQTKRLRVLNATLYDALAERERAAASLRASEERFRSAFESSASGMALIGLDLRVVRVNAALCEMLDCAPDQIVGRPIAEFSDAAGAGIDESSLRDLLSGAKPHVRLEKRYRRRDGTVFWALVTRALVRDAAGRPLHIIAHVDDIDVRKTAEERLAAQAATLAASNAELEQFAYVASHDLQEPLRMVSSYTQLLSRRYKGQLGADADEFIDYAVDGARRMQTLIEDLLVYSRVGRRGELQPVDLNVTIAAARRSLAHTIERSGARIDVEPLPTVEAVPFEMEQLLQNLLSNALKFHGERPPQVEIRGESRDGECRIAVSDHGIGIEPQYRRRIFLMFQRLQGRDRYPGNGIGLALCKKIVERHGGRIGVDSVPGEGATFWFTIPKRGRHDG